MSLRAAMLALLLRLDMRLLLRHGVIAAVGVVSVVWAALFAVLPVELLLGTLLLSVPVLLVALGVAARASTVTAYLFALQPATVPAVVPLVMIAGWMPRWLAWLGPTTGPYLLLDAGTGGPTLTGPEATAAVVVPVVTSVLLWHWTVARVRVELFRAGRLV